MIFFAHSGHDHSGTHETLGATTSNESNLGLIATAAALLLVTIAISVIYVLKQRAKKDSEKAS